jgi:uncharacterized protein YjiS (DUF1127 family)
LIHRNDWSVPGNHIQLIAPTTERKMSKRHPIVDKVVDAIGNWRRRRRDIREMRELDGSEFAQIARELNVPTTDLDAFVHQGPHASDELLHLLTLLGLDKDLLSKTQPLALRDMTRVCASCQQKRQCNRDLSTGASAQHYEEYCLNAPVIEELKTKTG